MRTVRFPVVILSLTLAGSAFAKPRYFNELQAKVGTSLTQLKCANCHGGNNPQSRNLFGRDFEKIVLRGTVSFTVAPLTDDEKWKTLLGKDSDGDGIENLAEMLRGTNPGVNGR